MHAKISEFTVYKCPVSDCESTEDKINIIIRVDFDGI